VRLIAELVKLELVRKSEFQPEKNIVRYETTIQGNALALAKAGKPVSRATADRVLQEFLDRVKRVNEQSELAYIVESVVVFGSYLTDRTKLNDLDIGVELTRRGKEKATDEKLQKERIARAFACGRRFGNLVEELFWPRTEVLLILKNRSRVISFCEWESLFQMPRLRYRVVAWKQRTNRRPDQGWRTQRLSLCCSRSCWSLCANPRRTLMSNLCIKMATHGQHEIGASGATL
jgi:predicted nucleotidyltransferase